jgi:hypothetical protein
MSQGEVNRYLEMMKAFNLDGSRDVEKWNAIQRQVDFAQKNVELYSKESEALERLQISEQMELARSLPGRIMPSMRLASAALVSIRAELKLEDASQTLKEELEKNLASMQAALDATLAAIEAQISAT